MPGTIYIAADHDVEYLGAQAEVVGTYLNSGTCTYVLKTAAGTTVPGGTGSCTYSPASSGDYYGTIESTVTALLSEDVQYYLEITFADSGYNDFRRIPLRAAYRTNP